MTTEQDTLESKEMAFNRCISSLVAHLLEMTPEAGIASVMNQMIFCPRPFTRVMVFDETSGEEADIVLLWELISGTSVHSLRLRMEPDGKLTVLAFRPEKMPNFLWTQEPVTPAELLAHWPKDVLPVLRNGFRILFGL